ncbi:ATP-dependent helicase NAM7 [Psilocybe cubensis]|uniref:DNA2/NAM7 helicase-like C-terminal domain-containing protein n=2 Tax=Psilocybe cubensis TaxID=181762 RepID=A0A8H7Y3A7_PSICU|nr:ATP-dependent helicase NAM7 [Psilocybe cubensis]KAH9481599.1 ATP-dependent helicase NAM7 [Psilocybe cubensis]
MPPTSTFTVIQDILDGYKCSDMLPTVRLQEESLSDSDLFKTFAHTLPLGISPGYSKEGRLLALSITDGKQCRIVEFFSQQPKRENGRRGPQGDKPTLSTSLLEMRKKLQDRILCRPNGDVFAFDMGPLAMSLYCDLGLRISRAVDVQSAFSAVDRKPISAIQEALGKDSDDESLPANERIKINVENVKTLFRYPVYDPNDRNTAVDLAVRAWVSQFLPGFGNGAEVFDKVARIDTKKLAQEQLDIIAKIAKDSLRLDQTKPGQTNHQFQQSQDMSDQQLRLVSTHYNTKLRRNQEVKMQVQGPNGSFTVKGTMAGVSGKVGSVNTNNVAFADKTITVVTSIGRDDPTTAEAHRAATVLRILQGSDKLLDRSPWIQNIWFPSSDGGPLIWPKEWSMPRAAPIFKPISFKALQLNSSQQLAVNSMMSEKDDHRIVLVQGPPGTGKTSVIASFIQFAILSQNRTGIWLVAQSNVAVKNIAEKLIKCEFFAWKLLVSKDFVFDWHEHLYNTKVTANIIRSDTFVKISKNDLQGTQVILCTLSMLSNSQLGRFTQHIPLRVLVVDEASQIEVGNYISIFVKFKATLRKACFIGDDKQLPPFGQEELQDLQSIFEITHLKKQVVFLDTQYRMPPQIGRIISKLVYDSKLNSNPHHEIKDTVTACYFINVPGKEKALQSGSFMNGLECEAILKLARRLQDEQKKFRIITPYEGQRATIEYALQTEGLDWGDKCFNVDSFQGNEEDFIIISLVRSRALGFLNNLRRTNVMLTRCKKGMFIVTSQDFLQNSGAKSLVGEFVKEMDTVVWVPQDKIEVYNF